MDAAILKVDNAQALICTCKQHRHHLQWLSQWLSYWLRKCWIYGRKD